MKVRGFDPGWMPLPCHAARRATRRRVCYRGRHIREIPRALTHGTSLERIGDESLTPPCSRFDHHHILIAMRRASPHAESAARRFTRIALPALTFVLPERARVARPVACASQIPEFIAKFFTPYSPFRARSANAVNNPVKPGTNRRRITDPAPYPFCSLQDVVVRRGYAQQVHSLPPAIRTAFRPRR